MASRSWSQNSMRSSRQKTLWEIFPDGEHEMLLPRLLLPTCQGSPGTDCKQRFSSQYQPPVIIYCLHQNYSSYCSCLSLMYVNHVGDEPCLEEACPVLKKTSVTSLEEISWWKPDHKSLMHSQVAAPKTGPAKWLSSESGMPI